MNKLIVLRIVGTIFPLKKIYSQKIFGSSKTEYRMILKYDLISLKKT